MTRTELWEKLWGDYIAKLQRIDELKRQGRYGYQLRMPYKSLDIAEKALLKEFPEAEIYTCEGLFEERKMKKPEMGLHSQEEQLQAVDMAADSLARGLDAAASNNLFGLASEIGYLRALGDLASSEGAEALATIAKQNAGALIFKFEKVYGEIG